MKIQSIIPVGNYSNKNKYNRNEHIGIKTENNISRDRQISNYYLPVSFSSSKSRKSSTDKKNLAEKSGNFIISKIAGTPCPACGKKMLNKKKFNIISQELAKLPPEQYLDYLGQYKEYMCPVEESVYDEIYKLSQEEGNSKDIRTLLVQLRNSKLPVLQKAQMRQLKKMRNLAKGLKDDEQKVLLDKLNSLEEIIHDNNATSPFRRKIMIEGISKVEIQNPKKYKKLQRIASQFPTSNDMNSAWIVKYSGKNKHDEDWNSYDIALRFLSSSVASTDHIIAYSLENNHDDISNYMSMHNSCNSVKGSKTFLCWLNENKENRIKYMRDYFNHVDGLIKDKKITSPKYQNYVAYATETVYKASNGQVDILGRYNDTNTPDNNLPNEDEENI